MEGNKLKIAMVTANGKVISGSFGSAKLFQVVEVENGQIVHSETREVNKFEAQTSVPNIVFGKGTGSFALNVFDKAKARHLKIAKTVGDCDYVLARAMCANAFDSIQMCNMKPILTDIKTFEDAVKQIHEGTIVNHTEKIHEDEDH